jgi:uncharacterized protein YfiM (DUF2279 family)
LNFKHAFAINLSGLIFFLSVSVHADEIPLRLKNYFETFEKGKKTAVQDHWFTADKGYHVMGSMISTTFLGQVSMRGYNRSIETSKLIGAGTTFTLGLAKEIYDSRQPQNYFSWKDLAANGVGILLGIILISID